MTARRNSLGRGLGALLPSPSAVAASRSEAQRPSPASDQATSSHVGPSTIPIDLIDPNPEQPRRVFAQEQLDSLVDSLRRHGVLQPVVVREAGDRYELIVGERRWRAARAAGLTHIPAVVSDVEPSERLEIAIVENVQRHDLNPIELAHAYRALAEAGHTQDQIGERVGMDRSSIANHLRLLDLSRDIQEDVEAGKLSMGHAKALLQVTNPERRRHLREIVIRDGLSVRETERRGRDIAGPAPVRTPRKPRPTKDPNLERLVDSLRDHLQTRVKLHGDSERGRIEIEYFGPEDLDRLGRLLLEGR
jgi:ParB family chromosome partitioning protein